MLTAIKGYFENGQIGMEEQAPVHSKTEVIIGFLTGNENTKPLKRIPGAFKGLAIIPDDFNEPLDDLKDYM